MLPSPFFSFQERELLMPFQPERQQLFGCMQDNLEFLCMNSCPEPTKTRQQKE